MWLLFCRYGGTGINKLNWEQINNEFGDSAGVFLLLVDLLLSIPGHSVECERGFSLLKIIKTDWRNRLVDDAVTDLICITLDAAEIKEFNPDPAIHLWQQAVVRGRRPNQKIWKKTKARRHKPSASATDSDLESDSMSLSDSEMLDSDDEIELVVDEPQQLLNSGSSESEQSDFNGF